MYIGCLRGSGCALSIISTTYAAAANSDAGAATSEPSAHPDVDTSCGDRANSAAREHVVLARTGADRETRFCTV